MQILQIIKQTGRMPLEDLLARPCLILNVHYQSQYPVAELDGYVADDVIERLYGTVDWVMMFIWLRRIKIMARLHTRPGIYL